MKFSKLTVGLAMALLPFSNLAAAPGVPAPFRIMEEKPWVLSTFQGLSVSTPAALEKMDFALPAEQKALFHGVESYMGKTDQVIIYGMFMHIKNGAGNVQGSLQGAIQNAVVQLQGTDFQIDFLEQNNQKSTYLATGTFTRGTEKMMVKGYAYSDQKGKIYVLSIFGMDDLKTDNAINRVLTSVKVQ
ncbi:hypothetical protein [Rufibacter hautae]|uniref:DUF4251 domain-containing protein n=1 Tax=Rufibacter hautae TaxID=2595005 RepID=A0A5B6T887_9BACT|nr:hypothetical protein [Rufibacter hautae]KAA3436127.1 hypothetical protein FOA19_17135 [Rufibacter hautae]